MWSGNAAAAPSTDANLIEQTARDLARQRGLTVRHPVQERDDPLGRLALQQIPGSAGADRAEKVLLGSGRRQDDDLAPRAGSPQARQRREPVEPRHRQVEQHEIRLETLGELERLRAVGGLADHLESSAREQGGERVARERVIVGDEDANSHVTLIGRRSGAD